MPNHREWLGFALAPLAPSLLLLAAAYPPTLGEVNLIVSFSLPYSYGSSLVFGLPVFNFLYRRQLLSTVNLTLGGALGGAIAFYIFLLSILFLLGSDLGFFPGAWPLVSGAVFGSAVAILFSLIAGLPLLRPQTK